MKGSISTWLFRNTANFVTLIRLLFCPAIIYVMLTQSNGGWTIFGLCCAAFATDPIDGWLARGLKIATPFGGMADRLVDKCVMGVMFYVLLASRMDLALKIAVIPIILVEIVSLTMFFLGLTRKMNVSTVKSPGKRGPGQIKMLFLCPAILFCLAYVQLSVDWNTVLCLTADILIIFLFCFSLFYGIKSVAAHIDSFRRQIRQADRLKARAWHDMRKSIRA